MRSWLLTLSFVVFLAPLLSAQGWTDDPLVQQVTVVKAVHVTELRTRINARRAVAELDPVIFTDPALTIGVTTVRAVHLDELRTALAEVYDALERPAPDFTDPVITPQSTVIKAVHIEELRDAIVALEEGAIAAVDLGSAGGFAILTKSGITNTPTSAVVGDVGTSPITGAAIHLTCTEVVGTIFAVDAAGPAPCAVTSPSFLTTAVSDMEAAYEDAKGRSSPDFVDLGAGEIGGLTLVPGLYKWNTNVLMSANVMLLGGPNDVWIFQISGEFTQSNGTQMTLGGGAVPKNIFWQVTETVSLGTTAHFEGVILGQTMITVNTGTSVNGRLFAQTAVTLEMNMITEPAP